MVDAQISKWVKGERFRHLKEVDAIIDFCDANGYVPVSSQQHVQDSSLRLKTACDLVVQKDNRLTMIEVKTNCLSKKCEPKKIQYMKHMSPQVSDCIFHQHQLQAVLSRYLLARTYNIQETDIDMCLLYVETHTGNVDVYFEHAFAVPHTLTFSMHMALHI